MRGEEQGSENIELLVRSRGNDVRNRLTEITRNIIFGDEGDGAGSIQYFECEVSILLVCAGEA